ncbi:MAG: S41 family peptidase [Lachnospiraceae bacterium]|nr:S41 family peptidase [Lachnospiraceae bacterium]MBQ2288615.1 S41 family peptidase [Lachnospiraceae bacterium]
MKSKNIGIFLAGMAFMGVLTFGVSSVKDAVIEDMSRIGHRYDYIESKLTLIDQVIDKHYLYEDEIDEEKLEEMIYLGYVAGLEESYTTYYTAEEFAEVMESSSGIYSGIGAYVSQNMNTGIITIVNPFEGAPAADAGVKKDDILFAVEGEEVTGMDLNMVVAKLKGEEGTRVNVTMYRPSEDEYIDFEIVRAVVNVPTVTHKMLDNHIGYIQLTEFDEVTVDQFNFAVEELTAMGMESLIFDLRDNGGGLMSSVCSILETVLPKGLLVYTEDKNGEREEEWAKNPDCIEVPMVVLVNGNTASASEIFAGALKDYDKAEIIGTTTFGKGIVQTIIPLKDGSAMKLTTSEYFTPDGIGIHGKGIEPDVIVEYDSENEEDNQLQAAVNYLSQ